MSDYSSTYPTQSPVFAFDAKAGKLDSRISYTRSSGGTYLSNEKALNSENLLLQSQDFDTSPWFTHNLATSGGLTGGQAAPDGTSTAWLMTGGVSSDSTSSPSVYMNLFGTAAGMVQPNSQNTYVMHVKAGTATHAWVTVRGDSANYVAAVLDFSNTSSLTTYPSGWTLDSSTVTALGSSWYRIAVTFTSNSAVSAGQVYVGPTNSNTLTTYYPQWGFNGETLYAWGAQLSSTNSKVYDSPTTTPISRKYSPLLKTAAANAARFEYAADGQSVGLLIESQVSNLVPYSENFGAWGATNVVAEAGAAVGPDGQPCYVMREDSSSGVNHRLSQNVSGQSTSTTYTMSVYAKKVATSNQTRYLRLRVNGIGGQASVEYDLSNGTVNRTTGTSLDSSSISSVGNGWYRLVMTYTNPSDSVASGMIITGSPDTTNTLPSYDGDGYSAFALFGASVEQSSSVSSYIKSNSGSTVSRASDSCSVDSATLFDNGDTTVMCAVTFPTDTGTLSGGAYTRIFRLENSSAAAIGENYEVYRNLDGEIVAEADAGGANVASYLVANSSPAGNYKLAVRYGSDSKAYLNGAAGVASDSAMPNPSGLDTLRIGSYTDTGGSLDGHIKRLSLYSVALSDTELQALTS